MSKFEVYERLFRNNTMEEYEMFCFFNFLHHKHYKPFNCALIMAQRPGAAFVRTERAWEKEGYLLKPEASPIVIMQVNGPVTLVYDREDVYSTSQQLRFTDIDNIDPAEQRIDDFILAKWLNQLCKKGIRIAESHMGERMYGKAEPLASPIAISYIEFGNGKQNEKPMTAYHQITLNSNQSAHDKALTLLHELGHLYCGHVTGIRSKANCLPEYRYDVQDQKLNQIQTKMSDIQKRLSLISEKKEYEAEYHNLETCYDTLMESRKTLLTELENQQEYEAQLVCKLLCKRNHFADNRSDDYLKAHTVNHSFPDISLPSVLDAVEKIAGILDI